MDLYKLIEEYQPFDEKEERYKNTFLQFLNNFEQDKWATRDNFIGHLAASAWVLNKNRDKVLMCYHNIYDSFAWLGGHADGDLNLTQVAHKEVLEESGLKEVKFISKDPIYLSVCPVHAHIKNNKFISAHLHLDCCYLFEADEIEELTVLPSENSDLKWVNIEDVFDHVNKNDQHMIPIYKSIMEKSKKFN